MIDRATVFEIHRLKDAGYSIEKIRKKLRISRKTVCKYLETPVPEKAKIKRPSILDPYKDQIDRLIDQDEDISAVLVKEQLRKRGYKGGITIVRDYLQKIRKKRPKQAFIRFESLPGDQMQIDWGHFGSLSYGDCKRKLYALAVIESFSRMLYVEFTHSQNQSTLHQCLINAFLFFGGTPKELVVDNMLTAVTERQGSLVRFNDRFLDFLRPFKIVPHACNVRSPQEKGKVEITFRYIRGNFMPLRTFKNLFDIQKQMEDWLKNVANIRIHQTTGERPEDRFKRVPLNRLVQPLPDYRETVTLKAHKDFAVRFDKNTYTVPPWVIGNDATLKADKKEVTIYYREKKIATHERSYHHKQRIELPAHKEQVKKLQNNMWKDRQISAFLSIGEDASDYLQALVKAGQPVKKNIVKLLSLKDEYGAPSLLFAIRKAQLHRAYGADYIENILYQEMTPQNNQPPVKLKNEGLNRIRLVEPSLSDYDALAIKRRIKND